MVILKYSNKALRLDRNILIEHTYIKMLSHLQEQCYTVVSIIEEVKEPRGQTLGEILCTLPKITEIKT